MYSTPCEDIPMSFGEIKSKLLVGVGTTLRVYEMGIKKLLRKHEKKGLPSPVISIKTTNDRIYAADVTETTHVLKYKPEDNLLYVFSDDITKRYTTAICLLDDDTVCGVDKFENFYVVRVPPGVEEDADDDPTASRQKWESGFLGCAYSKLDSIC